MSDNDLSSKLSKGMRRAKQSSANEPARGPIAASTGMVREGALGGEPQAPVIQHSGTRDQGAGRASTRDHRAQRFAGQDDQAPPASLDSPWRNLHPKRIWPD